MAINIQEILHPSDSNQIKWEKVNYNFDQILANGGGPKGQKGSKGIQGAVGQTGAKGEQGFKGEKGETGATTSRWKVITVDESPEDGIAEYVILKPKVSTDNYHPVIFLGDQTFDELADQDGEIRLRSTLTIGRHAVGGLSPSNELLTLWHGERTGTTNNIAITLSTSEETDGTTDWTRFTLDETYGLNLNANPAEVIEFYAGLDKWTFNTNVSFDGADSTLKLPNTFIPANQLEAGMIRFYDNSFWGVIDNAGTLEWKQFCMAPCGGGGVGGSVSILEEGDLVLNQFGNPWGNSVNIVEEGDLELNNTGQPWGNSVNIVEEGDLELNNTGQPWGGNTTTTTASPSPTPYTISFDDGDIAGLSSTGGAIEIFYTTGPVDGLVLYDILVTAPSWVTIDSFLEGSLDCTVNPNLGGARSGVITIKHPNNIGVTDTITISQNAAPATTQAPTTQAPITTTTDSGSGGGSGETTTTQAPITLTLYDNGSATAPVTFSTTATKKLVSWSISQSGSVTVTNVPSWLTASVANLASNGGTITLDLANSPIQSVSSVLTVEDSYGNTGSIWVQYDAGSLEITTTTTDSGSGGGTGETTTTDSGAGGGTGETTTTDSGAGGGTGETTTTTAPTDSGGGSGDSGTGAGCNQYYVANTSSYNSVSFYCPSCGCDGQSVSISGVMGTSYQQSQYTFCSSLSHSELGVYLTGTGNGFISPGSGVTGACAPGSNYPGAPN